VQRKKKAKFLEISAVKMGKPLTNQQPRGKPLANRETLQWQNPQKRKYWTALPVNPSQYCDIDAI
jgi:hypothetical protein